MPNFDPDNAIEMRVSRHMDSPDGRCNLRITRNLELMTISMYRHHRKTGMTNPITLTYEEAQEVCDHLQHMMHGTPLTVPVEQHIDELDEIDQALGAS